MNYLTLFSKQNLALLSDWLQETGELYVDVYWPHSAGRSSAYLIRSMQNLKSLVSQQNWHEIIFTIFRRVQFPLRGIADERLLDVVLCEIPDGEHYQFVHLKYFPDKCADWGEGTSHAELRNELAEVFGRWVGIGQEPTCMWDGTCDPEEVFEVDVLRKNNFEVRKNQDFYERYVREPKRYQWIEEMWQE